MAIVAVVVVAVIEVVVVVVVVVFVVVVVVAIVVVLVVVVVVPMFLIPSRGEQWNAAATTLRLAQILLLLQQVFSIIIRKKPTQIVIRQTKSKTKSANTTIEK